MRWNALEDRVKQRLERFDGKIGLQIEMDEKIFEQNSEEMFQSLSLINIPILIEAFRQSEERKIYLNQPVTIPIHERVGGSGVIHALTDKIFMTIEDIIALMIIVSDNTATNVLISLLGQDKINGCMKKLGMEQTVLNRKMMDVEAIEEGKDNYTTAADMLAALKTINEGTFLTIESSRKILAFMRKQPFIGRLSGMMDLERVSVVTISGCMHDCAIVTFGEKTVYVAVLTDQLSTEEEGRHIFTEIGKLVYEYVTD